MICPHCGKETTVPKKVSKNKEIYAIFLEKWNAEGIITHKKVTTRMKKVIDKVIKNADYTQEEIFTAFKNYAQIIYSPGHFWDYKWTMEDFLNRGLHKFVDEAEPFDNNKKDDKLKPNNANNAFDCGGSSY